MPIEFHCPSCNKLLKTPDATAGKKGKCPHCQSVMDIPTSSTAQNWPPQSQTPAPSAPAPSAPAPQHPAAGDFISFHCQSCQKLLKTPPQTAGKQGKCPHCGSLMHIPLQSTAQPESSGLTPLGDSSGLEPLGNSSGLTPLGGGSAPAGGGLGDMFDDLPALQPTAETPNNPFGASGGTALRPSPLSSNPYASPSPGAAPRKTGGRGAAKSKVMGPAIGIICYIGLAFIVYLANLGMMVASDQMAPPPEMQGPERTGYIIGFYGALCIQPVIFLLILAGAIMMLNLKSYGLAMTSCIMSLLPCSVCCPLGLGFGIWGLVVLNDEKVKRAFN